MNKILAGGVIIGILGCSLFIVFNNKKSITTSSNSDTSISTNQNEDLLAKNEVNSVSQVEADNFADDVALDPNK